MLNDSFAYLPLLVAAATALIVIIILAADRERYRPAVLFLYIASALLVAAAAGYTILNPMLFPLAAALALSTLLMLLAAVINRLARVRKSSENPNQPAVQEEAEPQEPAAPPATGDAAELMDASRSFILTASQILSRDCDLSPLLDLVNDTLIRETGASGGAILLVDEFQEALAVRAFAGDFPPPYQLPEDLPHKVIRIETNFRFAQFPLAETIFGAVASSGQGELIAEPLSDSRIVQNGPEEFLRCGSYLLMPLKIQGMVIGVAALARRFGTPAFTQKDYDTADMLCTLASAAIKTVYSYQEAMERTSLLKESAIANRLQETLHPKSLPAVPGLSLGVFQQLAKGICGDYYDIIPSRKDRISFILGDVAGRGMTSLLIMVMLRSMLRLTVNTTQSAATILSWVNRGIAGETSMDHFASVALINYDSERRMVQIATGGTIPVILYRAATEKFKTISSTSEPLGVEKWSEYQDKELPVSPGDILIAYTDGLIEAPGGRGSQYSKSRLLKVVSKHIHRSAREIANCVKTDLIEFSEGSHQHDDQTLMVIKIK